MHTLTLLSRNNHDHNQGNLKLTNSLILQYSEVGKNLSSSLEQVGFLAGQIAFKAYLPNGQGSRRVILEHDH